MKSFCKKIIHLIKIKARTSELFQDVSSGLISQMVSVTKENSAANIFHFLSG